MKMFIQVLLVNLILSITLLYYPAVGQTADLSSIRDADIMTIRVKLERAKGPGPHFQSVGKFSPTPTDSTARFFGLHEMTKGDLPKGYESLSIGTLTTDFPQMAFSAIKRGVLDSAKYYGGWFSDDSPEELSRMTTKYVDTEVSVAYGDIGGQYYLIIDKNNDESFEGESIIEMPNSSGNYSAMMEPKVFSASVEKLVNRKIVQDSAYFTIANYPQMVGIGQSEHRYGSIVLDGEEKHIYATNSFYGIQYRKDLLEVLVSDSIFEGSIQHRVQLNTGKLEQGDVFRTSSFAYRIKDIDGEGLELILERVRLEEVQVGTQVGLTAPMIEGWTLDNKLLKLKNRSTIKLIDFWGTWCAPCIAEIPYLKDARELFSDQNFEIISIAQDTKSKVIDFVEKRGLNWTHLMENEAGNVIDDYKVSGFPSTFLLSSENEVLVKETSLRGPLLIYNLMERLDVTVEEVKRKLNVGNVILEVENGGYHSIELKADFTENKVTFYQLDKDSGVVQRGFNIEPGEYTLGFNASKEGSGYAKLIPRKITVTNEPNQLIKISLKDNKP